MTDSRLNRQQLYDKIRETSKDEFILNEMIRLGFWDQNKDKPQIAEGLIRKEGELNRELNELLKQQSRYQNRELMLRELRKKRLKESKEKQAATKLKRKQERELKTEQWKASKEKDIIYLGEGYSSDLNDEASDIAKLAKYKLPHFETVKALANTMGISVNQLRFLSYSRNVSKVSHYKKFTLPKKTGGERLISAPMPKLKEAQKWVLGNILLKLPNSEHAHGFIACKSILTNAKPHVGQDIVINIDLQDFFPSVHYKRIKAMFHSFGYSWKLSTIFALLCSEPETDLVKVDHEEYHVATGERKLPQGAPTSPAISNILCHRLDRRIKGAVEPLGYNYTRYADDMTFSAKEGAVEELTKVLWRVKSIIKDEGFVIHPDKLKIMRKGARQEVTGVVVNEKLNINRKTLNNFRALLFQIEKDGIENKHWNGSSNLLASIKGYAEFVKFVNPEKGAPLVARVKKILKEHEFKHVIKHKRKPKPIAKKEEIKEQKKEHQTSAELAKKKPWWKFW